MLEVNFHFCFLVAEGGDPQGQLAAGCQVDDPPGHMATSSARRFPQCRYLFGIIFLGEWTSQRLFSIAWRCRGDNLRRRLREQRLRGGDLVWAGSGGGRENEVQWAEAADAALAGQRDCVAHGVCVTVVLRIVESVCASDRNCAAALPTSKNCSPLLRLVALGMVHEAQGTIFTGYFYESSFRNLQCQIYET